MVTETENFILMFWNTIFSKFYNNTAATCCNAGGAKWRTIMFKIWFEFAHE